MSDDLPLLNWSPPQKVIPFPSKKMIGKARDVAFKAIQKNTDRALAAYLHQISKNEFNRLLKIGICEAEADRHVQDLMTLVSHQISNLQSRSNKKG